MKIAAGQMDAIARRFIEQQSLPVSGDDEIERIKPIISRLRKVLCAAVLAEGHKLEGSPIQSPTADRPAYLTAIKFGKVVNQNRHLLAIFGLHEVALRLHRGCATCAQRSADQLISPTRRDANPISATDKDYRHYFDKSAYKSFAQCDLAVVEGQNVDGKHRGKEIAVPTFLSVSEAARRLGMRPKDISDAFYQRRLRDDLCPIIAGRRLIPDDYIFPERLSSVAGQS